MLYCAAPEAAELRGSVLLFVAATQKTATGNRCGFLWAGHPATSVAAASFRT